MIRRAPRVLSKFVHDPIIMVGIATETMVLSKNQERAIANRLVRLVEGVDVTVGADPSMPLGGPTPAPTPPASPSTMTWMLPTGIGAVAGAGIGFFTHISPIFIALLTAAGGSVGYLISQ